MYNDIDNDDYKSLKIYVAFDDSYVEYHSEGDKDKILSIKEYLDMIKPCLSNIMNDHEDEWKIQLSMRINSVNSVGFKDSGDSNKPRIMYTNSDNVFIMIGYETDEFIEKLFKSLLERYQQGLEENTREGSVYVFYSVDLLHYIDLLHYRHHKISLNRGGSHIDSPKWLKNKNATISPKNNDDKCFQYAVTVALNYRKINNHPKEIYSNTPFINRYDWNEIEFLSHTKIGISCSYL